MGELYFPFFFLIEKIIQLATLCSTREVKIVFICLRKVLVFFPRVFHWFEKRLSGLL